ncbi:hypothetical protein HMPREF9701_01868 [Delftia acidovorans CCUG 274B]|jgi:bacteriorhodopsin|uniref:hypothetical protein n=1 Tax=Delftia TaxID=80865 RepID=UPI000353DD2C|nr:MULTISPECIES: hypothetical protein [Delftia]EPD41314.1 hypothetical protein HMPREF9701_01868 [Delftia acidovorans CCUG 274B]
MARRKHPLVSLVLWLAVALMAALCALVFVVARQTPPPDFNAVFLDGLAQGNAMCKEQ